MLKNIAVDSGKFATKIAIAKNGVIEHGKFLTKMDPGTEKPGQSDSETFAVEFEGQSYILGKQARTQDFDDSKMKEIHKIATYAAIGSEVCGVGNGDHVNLAIGCPLATYTSKEDRLRYKDYIAPQGKEINIVIDGRRKHFIIERSFVFPESSGVIYLNQDKYRDNVVGVVDVGGLNANCCIYEHNIPKAGLDTMFTLDLGGNVLTKTTATAVQQRLGTGNLNDYNITDMMEKGGLKNGTHEASARIVKECKLNHVKKIYDACKAQGWNLEFTEIVFTGGAAKWLKDEIIQVFPYYDIDNLGDGADFKNVDGFLMQMLARTGATL